MGSKRAVPDPILADGITRIDPTRAEAAWLRISPNMLVVSTTSNCDGFNVNCIAALSTYMCSSRTSGYASPMEVTVLRHNCELARTLALSTEHTRRDRLSARVNANVVMRSISGVEYASV